MLKNFMLRRLILGNPAPEQLCQVRNKTNFFSQMLGFFENNYSFYYWVQMFLTTMVLCSSRDDPKEVEPLAAPEGSQPGDKVN